MTPRPEASVVHGSKAQAAQAHARLQDLPSVDRLLRQEDVAALVAVHGHTLVAHEARGLLESLRSRALPGPLNAADLQAAALSAQLAARVAQRLAPRMRPLLNLTRTVIHTHLGRALLADDALAHLLATMAGPNNLEYDLASGGRGDRDSLVEDLLCTLTGAEAATVVNNNAAAVLLTLAALARGREVIVSRGELVEIGGAFRMPDVMSAAGPRMVEVGTTNRTHPRDYERAITAETALLMKVRTSNYAVQGFTAAVDEAGLARLAHARGLPVATDLGSGALVDLSAWGLPHEPTPQDMLAAGCDIVTFSGDKLLGGPQAGLIVGRRDLVEQIRRCPMKRALRMSKLPLAALEATLRLYLRPERLARELPTLRLLTRTPETLRTLALQIEPAVAAAVAPRFSVAVVDLMGQIGSGSLPVERLPSAGLALASTAGRKGSGRALDALAAALRALPRPVVGRIAEDRLLLDLRGLEDPALLERNLPALQAALDAGASRVDAAGPTVGPAA